MHVTTVPMSLLFLAGQLEYVRTRGYSPVVATSPGPELERLSAGVLAVPVHTVPMTRRVTPLRDLWGALSLFRLMRRLRPAIVHGHTPKGGLLAMIAAAAARVPVRVYHLRGLPLSSATGLERWVLRIAERVTCRLAHAVVAVSHSLRDLAVAEGLCGAGRIRVLGLGSGNGVDAAGRFDPGALPPGTRSRVRSQHGIPADATVLGFVGRLVRDKGLVELAEAWWDIRHEFPRLHLLLVGPVEEHAPLPAGLLPRLQADDRVHLVGLTWDIPELYAAMDVLILPTYREGFPNVVLEAGAMQLPVIASAVTGCVDAVEDGRTGTLVTVRDSGALADAIRLYVRDPELRRRHGRAGRERAVRDFGQERVWAELCDQYDALSRTRRG